MIQESVSLLKFQNNVERESFSNERLDQMFFFKPFHNLETVVTVISTNTFLESTSKFLLTFMLFKKFGFPAEAKTARETLDSCDQFSVWILHRLQELFN